MPQTDGFVITAKPAVHFGPGALAELPGIVRATGADQVVVVTDVTLASAPVIETVLTVLADAGLPARLFAGVHPQPAPGDLAAGADAVAQAAADAATTAADAASAAAVAAMLKPSAPLVSGPHPVLRPSAPSEVSGPHPVPRPSAPSDTSGPHPVLRPSARPAALRATHFASPPIALVAVGGRASIDAAKGIAITAFSPRSGQDLDRPALDRPALDRHRDPAVPALPIVAVPVTIGTGTETSGLGLVTDPADGRTFQVGDAGTTPVAVILDPDLTAGLPPAVTAGCGLDTLTRALESYLSLRPNPWSDGIALQVIRMVAASLPRAVMDGTDLTARSQLLLAGHMAGVAAASTGLGLCHAIARSLATPGNSAAPGNTAQRDAVYPGAAPGAILAVLLPEVLRFNLPARVERMAEVAFALGVGDTHADTWLNAEAAIGAVTALRDDMGLSRRLSDFGVTETDFPRIAAAVLTDEALASTPRPPAGYDIQAILLAAAGQPR